MSFELPGLGTSSGDLLSTAILPPVFAQNTLTTPLTGLGGASQSLLFVDRSVTDYQQLVAGVTQGTEIHVLDPVLDAVTQITNTLLGRQNIGSLHIVSHGEAGGLDFGNSKLNLGDLPGYASQLQSWGNALTNDADILLYGCNVAQGELGQTFVQNISQLTRADVAASSNLTGNSALGGDWNLEVSTGQIETAYAFLAASLQSYQGVLQIVNGSFETGDFTGWTKVLESGSSGDVFVTNSTTSPRSGSTLPTAPNGSFFAVTDQSGAGAYVLYQDIALEANASHTLTFQEFIGNRAGSFSTPNSMSFSTNPNQQVRVDILSTSTTNFFTGPATSGVLANIFQTAVGSTAVFPNYQTVSFNLDSFAGQTIRLAFRQTDNQNIFQFGIDDVKLTSTPLNAPPTITLTGTVSTYAENAQPLLLDGSATVTDSDSANFNTGTLTVNFSVNGTVDDRLLINNQGTAAGQIGVSGSNVTFGGTQIGTFTGGVGTTPLVITFNSSSSPTAAQALLRNLGYSNVSDAPTTSARTISVVLTDGDGGTSTAATKTINVTAVDDPSVLTVSDTSSYTANAAAGLVAPNLTLTDPDGLDGARVSIGNNFDVNDRLGIAGESGISGTINGLTWSYDTTKGILSLTGVASATAYQDTLRQVTYSNISENPIAGDRAIQFALGANLANPDNGHFYEFVDAGDAISWTDARDAATARNYFGLQGYLVTVTSAAESSFVSSKLQGQGWLGASDEVVENEWRWVTGPEAGQQFWQGLGNTGSPVGGLYNNWNSGEPNNQGDEDYGQFLVDGKWNDLPNSIASISGYVVEYGGLAGDPTLQLTGNATVTVTPVNHAYTGGVAVVGTVSENQVLTAVSTISDPDGNGTLTYQWEQSVNGTTWVDVNGATNATFAPNDAQVGQFLRVRGSFVDGGGSTETFTSTATASRITNVNDAPTGSVSISGIVQENAILTASNTLVDADGLGPVTYQWQESTDGSNWNNITGAINATLTLDDAQNGKFVRTQASYTDLQGTVETVDSAATASRITNVNDAPTGSVSISGTVQENAILTASNTLVDADGLGLVTYQWQESTDGTNWNNITGAINATLTLDDAQSGKFVRTQASYTDLQGTAETVDSAATVTTVTNVNDAPTGSVSISGTVQENDILTASNTLVDADGLGLVTYQWQESTDGTNWSNITGAINATLTLGDAQSGKFVRTQASYTDLQGTVETVASPATASRITNVNDAPTGSVSIAGMVEENAILTASNTLVDADGLGPVTYQWQESTDGTNWNNITGAINSTLTLNNAQSGKFVRTQASYTDLQGTVETVDSASTVSRITNVNDAPTLTGNATLTAVTQNTTNPSGSTLTSLFASLFSDIDTGASLSGLAIVSNTATTQGRWEYSTDGTNWASVGAVADDATALALSATTLVRFVPVTGYNGTPPGLTVRALDNSYSNGFTNGTTRVTVNTTSNGGTTAISSGTPAALDTSVTQSLPNLVWRNSGTGENAVWQLNNFTLQSAYFLPTVADPNWQIASTADFNSDGIADLLWRNKASGENVIWQMNSTGVQTDHFITKVPDASWEIASTADFNSDGIADILWRSKASGQNVIWRMNSNFTLQSDHFITQVPDTNWQIVGTDDFNGDGIVDILWRSKASGQNVIWQMNSNFTLQSDHFITQVSDINWQIAGTDDFNGDGIADILWRNKLTGKEDIWEMNGFSLVKSYQLADVIDPNWSVRPFVVG